MKFTFYGKSDEQMTREELVDCAVFLNEELEKTRKELINAKIRHIDDLTYIVTKSRKKSDETFFDAVKTFLFHPMKGRTN